MAATTTGLIEWVGAEARGAHVHPALGVVGEQGGGHLGAPRVVHAQEQHLGHVLGCVALGLGQGGEPVGGEALRE